jgi:hypothetical protein
MNGENFHVVIALIQIASIYTSAFLKFDESLTNIVANPAGKRPFGDPDFGKDKY